MKMRIAITLLAGLLGASGTVLADGAAADAALEAKRAVLEQRRVQLASHVMPVHLLEPCMNGGVSASGLYPTQAAEDAALADAMRRDTAGEHRTAASER